MRLCRRLFVNKLLLGFSAGLLVPALFFNKRKKYYHVCEIEVFFDKRDNHHDFVIKRNVWMSVDKYKQLVENFMYGGQLIRTERYFENGLMRMKYFFKDKVWHDEFVKAINENDIVKDKIMPSYGFVFKRKYYGTWS